MPNMLGTVSEGMGKAMMRVMGLFMTVCTTIGIFVVLMCILAAGFIAGDIVLIKRDTKRKEKQCKLQF